MTENQKIALSFVVIKQPDGWWVISPLIEDSGPYRTKQEALEAKRGKQDFWRNCHKRGFVRYDH